MGGAHPTSRRPAGVWSRSARTSTGRTTRWLVFAARRGDAVDVGLGWMSAARQGRLDHLPVAAVAGDRDRAELVGAQERHPVRRSRLIVSEWGWPYSLFLPMLATASSGRTAWQPARVGPVAAAVVGQLEYRAVAHQVGVVFQPPLPLRAFAVSGQENRERTILQPQADRVVVFVLVGLRGAGGRS